MGSHGAGRTHPAAADVVLLDLGLPDLDGLDVCQKLLNPQRRPAHRRAIRMAGWRPTDVPTGSFIVGPGAALAHVSRAGTRWVR
ncbi:hypothetical protein SBI_01414 [Streptomyces bingchenggensis BCW-1]|uniref:Uncharacterized protein n=1 Tax=Streptomyces bingchenggensis (strain BCW-1) TaxID=749414 RepID=D7CDM0_STRBB|nr:hypothetical protein SBI_01414 [Streptomyces bingchenggensis BCW-1]